VAKVNIYIYILEKSFFTAARHAFSAQALGAINAVKDSESVGVCGSHNRKTCFKALFFVLLVRV